jgi:O-antigen/teichoic acid export membrane protein
LTQESSTPLRRQVFRGGAYLSARQLVGLAINLFGPIYLLRKIGPDNYGLYATVLGILTYLALLATWGVEIYLTRHSEEEECPEIYHQGFTILVVLAATGVVASLCAIPLLDRWLSIRSFQPVAHAMFLGLPLLTLRLVPLAKLERRLDYRRITIIELGGQLCFYAVALPIAVRTHAVWAPVVGWWFQQALLLVLFFVAAGYRPCLRFEPGSSKRILGYGLGISASLWIWQLRMLVNPLVVGRFAGAEAVGYVALAVRVAESLSFAKSAAWRISIAALAKIQNDLVRLSRAISQGMSLQSLAVGPPLLAFALAGSPLIRTFFGGRWSPVMLVYPFIALSYLVNSVYSLHSSALYVLAENWDVALFHLVHISLFAGAALLLVDRLGIRGYGWAEIVAMPSYVLLHVLTSRRIAKPPYSKIVTTWWLAFGLAFFEPLLGWPALLGLAFFLWPSSLRCLAEYAKEVIAAMRGK